MKNLKRSSLLILTILSLFFVSCEKNEVTNLSVDKSDLNLTIGEVDSILVSIEITGDINKLSINYSSSSANVVLMEESSVSSSQLKNNGIYTKTFRITGNKVGTTTITFQSGEKSYNCSVTVDDNILPEMTQGDLWYFGDPYETGVSNNFILYLCTAGINMEDLSGNGEVIFLELNTDMAYVDSIPVGVYEMTTLDTNKFLPFTLVPAYVENDNLWGSWYFGRSTNDIVTGSAEVSAINNQYKIEYSLIDYYGNTISETFQNNISYHDATISSGLLTHLKV